MIGLLAALVGATVAIGLILVVVGVVGVPDGPDGPSRWSRSGRPGERGDVGWNDRLAEIGPWVGVAVLAFIGGWLITGWPAFGATLVGGIAVARAAVRAGRRRRRRDALTLALAGWAEMLADVMRSHSALGQAIQETAGSTADVLRPAVLDLAAGAQAGALRDALVRFARSVDHGTADLIVTALQIADEGQGRNVPAVLDKIAEQTRDRTEMLLRVEASRSRVYSEAKTIVAITLALVLLAVVLGRAYLEPYETVVGQMVLLVVGGFFVAAGAALIVMGRPIELPRLLSRTSVEGGRP